MNSELISVILPVYNGQPYLGSAIDSILAQDYSRFELIIINDGSTDTSWETIKSYKDNRIRAYKQENCNLPCTLMRGLEFAQGNYVARMDQDDVSRSDRLSKQIEYLHSHPQVGMVGTSYRIIDQSGKHLGDRHQLTHPFHVRRQMYTGNPFCHGSVMFRREIILLAGNYDKTAHIEDFDLWCRLMSISEMGNMPDVLYDYRVNLSNSLVARNRQLYSDETHRLTTLLWDRNAPEVLDADAPAEILENTFEILKSKYNRSRRFLYNQTGLNIMKKRYQAGDRLTARKEWQYLIQQNLGILPEFVRILSAIRWLQ